jgi:hypothetical protein
MDARHPSAEDIVFLGTAWIVRRTAAVTAKQFGAHSHPEHVGRQLRMAGWIPREWIRRAAHRHKAAVDGWITA